MVDRDARATPVVDAHEATLHFGERVVWQDLDLALGAGEFLAVLGPNGAGKTSLIRVLLGLQSLTSGRISVAGRRPRRGNRRIGYVPQQRGFDREVALRSRDFVQLGLDGHRWGIGRPSPAKRATVDAALEAVGASGFADAPLGRLSGGEQQRLRIAQALVGEPVLLLCDEPLLSLDLRQQHEVAKLIDQRRRAAGIPVVFVTHEINPVLPYVDKVLYLVDGRWALGRPADIMTSDRLSDLYRAPVDVLRIRDRLVVVAGDDAADAHHLDQPVTTAGR